MLLPNLIKLTPDWTTRAVFRPRNWKLFLRCWISTWVCFILILPSKSLETMGSAYDLLDFYFISPPIDRISLSCFFACMACFLLPPNVTFQVYLFSIAILLLGCLVGWAWGSIAMAVAFAARDNVSLGISVQAQESIVNEPNPVASLQKMVFRGDFLDTRSTIIFGVFLRVGTFMFTVLCQSSQRGFRWNIW
ncbi:hypothetical protein RSAG8_12842, partial [Rhizoctonia solani AG-8 WAC10335]